VPEYAKCFPRFGEQCQEVATLSVAVLFLAMFIL